MTLKRNLILKSLTLSFFLHVFLLTNTSVIFPLRPSSFKPKFIFLGAVLKEQDIAQASLKEKLSQSSLNYPDSLHLLNAMRAKEWAMNKTEKALLPSAIHPGEKITIKSNIEPLQAKNPTVDLKTLGIDSPVESFKPLKLYLDD